MEPLETNVAPVLKLQENIRAVVFDFYGTMFMSGTGDTVIDDPKGDEAAAFEEAFKTVFPDLRQQPDAEEGVTAYKEAIHIHKEADRKNGIDYPEVQITEVWEDVLGSLRKKGVKGLPENPDQELLETLTVEFEMRNNPTWPLQDLDATLAALKASGMLLGILSNSQFYTPLIYEAHMGSEPDQTYFDVNLCIWSFEERRCKPSLPFHGRLKQALEAHHSLAPEEVLYVGNDMLKDIWPAAHFGFRTALFAGDERSLKWRRDDDRTADLKPDLVISRLYQLVDCVGIS